MDSFQSEVKKGQRFEFGKNWKSFLSTLTDARRMAAEESIKEMLKIDNLKDETFLDMGSGSGLFSLAARKLGAKIRSIDYDPASVACSHELRSRYFPDDPNWVVEEGSALDESFLKSLGKFDIVYSWGVLHHTGSMWEALENIASLVKPNGTLFVAIYNDQGIISTFWKKVKKIYCSGFLGKWVISSLFVPYYFLRALGSCIPKKENVFSKYKKQRGMSITHDWFDWLGGYPFEVASVEEIFHFFQKRGFALNNIKTTNGQGNNEFVFTKIQRKQDLSAAM